MNEHVSDGEQALLAALTTHPLVTAIAIVGSRAHRAPVDALSDLDLHVVVTDVGAFMRWTPSGVLMHTAHWRRHRTFILDDFGKVDLAVYAQTEDQQPWVVVAYDIVKDAPGFRADLDAAMARTHGDKAARNDPDVTVDNLVLLLSTATQRCLRGEYLSAHGALNLAGYALLALEARARDVDIFDARRHAEQWAPDLAQLLHTCLFNAPTQGARALVAHVLSTQTLNDGQRRVLDHLRAQLDATR